MGLLGYQIDLQITFRDRYDIFKTNYLNGPCLVKRGLNIFAKSIGSCQPAQSAQADMDRNFSLSLFIYLFIYLSNNNAILRFGNFLDKMDIFKDC